KMMTLAAPAVWRAKFLGDGPQVFTALARGNRRTRACDPSRALHLFYRVGQLRLDGRSDGCLASRHLRGGPSFLGGLARTRESTLHFRGSSCYQESKRYLSVYSGRLETVKSRWKATMAFIQKQLKSFFDSAGGQ